MKRKIIIYISMCLCIAFIITMGNISEFTGDKSEKIECVYAAGTDSLGTSDIQEKIEEAEAIKESVIEEIAENEKENEEIKEEEKQEEDKSEEKQEEVPVTNETK